MFAGARNIQKWIKSYIIYNDLRPDNIFQVHANGRVESVLVVIVSNEVQYLKKTLSKPHIDKFDPYLWYVRR